MHERRERRTRNVALWLDVSVKVWFDEGEPLLDATFNVSTSLADIAEHWLAVPDQYRQAKRVAEADSHRLDKQRSASASAKIFISSMLSTRASCSANMPSRIMTCGE